jgi:hypothetical protein
VRFAQEYPLLDGSFAVVDLCFVSTLCALPRHCITLVLPTNISSILTDHDELFELPGCLFVSTLVYADSEGLLLLATKFGLFRVPGLRGSPIRMRVLKQET